MKFLTVLIAALCLAGMARAEIEIQEIETPAGFKAWLVEEPSIPFVSIELRFRGGTSLDLPEKRGSVSLMTALLEEGAGERDARAFTEATESLAASFGFNAYDDAVAVSAKVLTQNRPEAMALLRDALVTPRFDADAIERVRAQAISSIRSDLKDPDTIAARTFDELAFGDHPYGSPQDGTEASVAALTRDDLIAAHRATLVRDRVYIAASGDISAPELAELIDTLLSDLPMSDRPLPEEVEVALQKGVTVVPFDTPQSVAQFGHVGIERDDPDFFAAYVLNQILGDGGFESRLMSEVREKRGLTYGIYTGLVPKDFAPLLIGRVASANDRIAEAMDVIRTEWERAREGVTETELAEAKTYLTGAYPLRFDSNDAIANILVGMQMDDLTPDYITSRNAKIEALTLEDIQRVAQRLLQPDKLHFVVVGQPVGVESTPGQ